MSKTSRKTVEKRLKCNKCGNIQSIHRLASRNRPTGHIKHLWCYVCKETTSHTEQMS